MRIACISSSYPSSEHPGAGSFVGRYVQLLREAGHDVTVFTWRAGTYDDDVHVVAPFGRRSVFAGSGAPDALEVAPWRALEAPVDVVAMVRELSRREPFDLYIGHWLLPGGLVARLAADRVRRPSLVIGHSGGVHALSRLPGPLRLGLQRKIIRASSTTVPSRALAEKLGGPVEVLPMGFDPVQAGSRREGILCFGRLVPIKGFDVALRQLANVSVPIHIVGAGPEEPRLREIVPHARFWGWADDALKREVFEECDRAIFPSRVIGGRHEGWPVSVLEVAHSGIVPFVSPWPGASELVVDGRQVVEDREWRRVGDLDVAELREAVVTHAASYTWDALRKRWLDVVQRAAHQSP